MRASFWIWMVPLVATPIGLALLVVGRYLAAPARRLLAALRLRRLRRVAKADLTIPARQGPPPNQ